MTDRVDEAPAFLKDMDRVAHAASPEGSAGAHTERPHIGIMGGTFDPIHLGHLACAEMARDAFGLDIILFMVAGRPSLKQDQAVGKAADRLAMCRLAIADNPAFLVSDMEIMREGITYTVDTLEAVRTALPENAALSFIMGSDSLEMLPLWRRADDLKNLAHFICVFRPGTTGFEGRLYEARAQGFDIDVLFAPLLDISSSEIRRRVQEGESIRYLVPLSVRDYIRTKGLYRTCEGDILYDA